MILRKGEMFDNLLFVDVLIVTGNSTLKTNGAVVMGRGAAMQMRNHFKGIDKKFGDLIKQSPIPYGLVIHEYGQALQLGLFQVKTKYSDNAKLSLIENSLNSLGNYLCFKWASRRVHMNFPGIGNGRLQREPVLEMLKEMPNNLTIWEKV